MTRSLRNPVVCLCVVFLDLTYLDLENHAPVLSVMKNYSFNEEIILFILQFS